MISAQILKAFNKDFCLEAQFRVTASLYGLADKRWERVWCDGILPPEMYMQEPDADDHVLTTGWLGTDGQTKHWVVFRVGACTIKNAMNGLSIIDCLPDGSSAGWITIDAEKQVVELQLK